MCVWGGGKAKQTKDIYLVLLMIYFCYLFSNLFLSMHYDFKLFQHTKAFYHI